MDVLIMAMFFLTPVFYPIEKLPETVMALASTVPVQRLMYVLNPMASSDCIIPFDPVRLVQRWAAGAAGR